MHIHQHLFTLSSLVFVCLGATLPSEAAEIEQLKKALLFHASFDKSVDADVARGDARIYTANSLKRDEVHLGLKSEAVTWSQTGGRTGGVLQFHKKSPELIFFKGGENVPFAKSNFSGTVSLWMRLNPQEDLPQGYVDPLQITDKTWNNASFFIDFDLAKERDFRLGAFADFTFWNPTDRKFDDIPNDERPMVFVRQAPFDRKTWTHVAFTWSRFNSEDSGEAVLYIDGKTQGTIQGKQRFTWNPDNVVIMLGINYVGWIDDLAIFNRALSVDEVKLIGR